MEGKWEKELQQALHNSVYEEYISPFGDFNINQETILHIGRSKSMLFMMLFSLVSILTSVFTSILILQIDWVISEQTLDIYWNLNSYKYLILLFDALGFVLPISAIFIYFGSRSWNLSVVRRAVACAKIFVQVNFYSLLIICFTGILLLFFYLGWLAIFGFLYLLSSLVVVCFWLRLFYLSQIFLKNCDDNLRGDSKEIPKPEKMNAVFWILLISQIIQLITSLYQENLEYTGFTSIDSIIIQIGRFDLLSLTSSLFSILNTIFIINMIGYFQRRFQKM